MHNSTVFLPCSIFYLSFNQTSAMHGLPCYYTLDSADHNQFLHFLLNNVTTSKGAVNLQCYPVPLLHPTEYSRKEFLPATGYDGR